MREIEYVIEGDALASLNAAMDDAKGREDTLWSHEIDVGDDKVVDLKLCGGGDGDPWVDAVLCERIPHGLAELYPLDVQDSPFGEFVFDRDGITLKVVEGTAPAPAP